MKIKHWTTNMIGIIAISFLSIACDEQSASDADAGASASAQPAPPPAPAAAPAPPPEVKLPELVTIDEQKFGSDSHGTIRTIKDPIHDDCFAVLGTNVNGVFTPVGFVERSSSACRAKNH